MNPNCIKHNRCSNYNPYTVYLSFQSWIGGVAQNLQNKMLTRLSPRHSEKLSASDLQAFDETMVNDVFMEPKSPFEESEDCKMSASVLLPPDKVIVWFGK